MIGVLWPLNIPSYAVLRVRPKFGRSHDYKYGPCPSDQVFYPPFHLDLDLTAKAPQARSFLTQSPRASFALAKEYSAARLCCYQDCEYEPHLQPSRNPYLTDCYVRTTRHRCDVKRRPSLTFDVNFWLRPLITLCRCYT